MLSDVASVTFQLSVVEPPLMPKLVGLAEKLLMVGGFAGTYTVTVVCAVLLPMTFVAVSVKVVVCVTLTVRDEPVTVPTPGLMLSDVASVTFQLNVALPPLMPRF